LSGTVAFISLLFTSLWSLPASLLVCFCTWFAASYVVYVS
jgi:hypothetical protein